MKRAEELLTHWSRERQRIAARELLVALEGGTAAKRRAELPKETVPTARMEHPGGAKPGRPQPREQAAISETTTAAAALLTLLSGEPMGLRQDYGMEPETPQVPSSDIKTTEAAVWLPLPGKRLPERVAEQGAVRFEKQNERPLETDQYRQMQRISRWFERDSRRCDPGFIRY